MTKSIHVVYAQWCPHCVPTVVEPLKNIAHELGLSIHLLDIDTRDEALADDLVKKYGDWNEDYLVPQVFIEFDDGTIKHVLTGDPRGIGYTSKRLDDLLASGVLSGYKSGKTDK
jgi:thiol-disulfide isomerase/thioredoxin